MIKENTVYTGIAFSTMYYSGKHAENHRNADIKIDPKTKEPYDVSPFRRFCIDNPDGEFYVIEELTQVTEHYGKTIEGNWIRTGKAKGMNQLNQNKTWGLYPEQAPGKMAKWDTNGTLKHNFVIYGYIPPKKYVVKQEEPVQLELL